MSVSITELQKHWDRAEIAGLNSSAVFQFPIIGQQSRAALVTSGASLCNLSRVFVMDVFSTSEEWTAVISPTSESCMCPATLRSYVQKYLHYTFLSSPCFEGVLQNSIANYFRRCSRNFFFFLYRMEDKGEVKCIKFSLGNKILAVQRTSKSVVRLLRPADRKGIGAETLVLRVPE